MKKFLSLILLLAILALTIMATASCKPTDKTDPDDGGVSDPTDPTDPPEDEPEKDPEPEEDDGYDSNGIIIPPYKDYGRDTESFDVLALDYARPDVELLCSDVEAVCEIIRANELPFEEQLAAIISLEPGCNAFLTMYSVAEILNSKDITAVFWANEYEYLSTTRPEYAQAVEDLYVACAKSPHARAFEESYFEEDISEYEDGGIYTDTVVSYMADEAELENEYRDLSPATVEIVYTSSTDTVTGTYEYVLEIIEERYKDRPSAYQNALLICEMLYDAAYERRAAEIFVELLKVRSLLSAELGYSSYSELAYDSRDYEYTPEDMMGLISDIGEFVMPAYSLLYSGTLERATPKWGTATLINNSYEIMKSIDEDFGDIYAYMLQHKLYDIALASDKRLDASFTTWIQDNNSPYLFVTTSGYMTDYFSLMHEFGHFIDGYVNNDEHTALEIAELCSQGMELMSLLQLKSYATSSAYDQMIYLGLMSTLETLWYQGVLACFEHLVYELPYDQITVAMLSQLLNEAESTVLGRSDIFGISDVLILHLYLSPMYVQSYCTSVIPAIEIYLLEAEAAGAGVNAYKDIIYRDEDSFLTLLDNASLTSPFADGGLEVIIGKLTQHLSPIISKYTG